MQRILITGSQGMLGSALYSRFKKKGLNVIGAYREIVDLRNFHETLLFFSQSKIDLIVHCAALVGGIQSNIEGKEKYFIENIQIDNSVLFAARKLKIQNLVYIGSSCMYPSNLDYAIKESDLLKGKIERTNENYGLAKIFGSRLTNSIAIEDGLNWRVFIASNLYGPNDYFHPIRSHLIGAIITKAIQANRNNLDYIEMWGDGTPKREFTYISDFVEWIEKSSKFLNRLPLTLNVGVGVDYTVHEYYLKIINALNLNLRVVPNTEMPNGTIRKLMDSSLARSFGWKPKINLENGIDLTISGYFDRESSK